MEPASLTNEIYELPLLHFQRIRKASLILRSLNHELRKRIMEYISEKGKTTVTELYLHLDIEQSIVSQHLALLRRSGILLAQKNKKFIHYSINLPRLKTIVNAMDEFVRMDENQ